MPAEAQTVDALTRVLVRTCRALADAGRPQLAGRLAADGWVVLRADHPRQALHLDGAMHYIARQPIGPSETPAESSEAASSEREEEPVMSEDRILDVRTEIPKRRHELIFETFNALEPGAAYVLVNDHDPKPLYYQFEAEHTGTYSWKYLEEGPEVWRVRIGRIEPAA